MGVPLGRPLGQGIAHWSPIRVSEGLMESLSFQIGTAGAPKQAVIPATEGPYHPCRRERWVSGERREERREFFGHNVDRLQPVNDIEQAL